MFDTLSGGSFEKFYVKEGRLGFRAEVAEAAAATARRLPVLSDNPGDENILFVFSLSLERCGNARRDNLTALRGTVE